MRLLVFILIVARARIWRFNCASGTRGNDAWVVRELRVAEGRDCSAPVSAQVVSDDSSATTRPEDTVDGDLSTAWISGCFGCAPGEAALIITVAVDAICLQPETFGSVQGWKRVNGNVPC